MNLQIEQIEGERGAGFPKGLASRRTRISNHLIELPDVLISRAKCCNLSLLDLRVVHHILVKL